MLIEQLILWQLVSAVINGAGLLLAACAIGLLAIRLYRLEQRVRSILDR